MCAQAQNIHQLVSTRLVATHHGSNQKYHGNEINAFHFLKIIYKKPRCPSPYEKLGRYSLYDWFINRGEVKSKYAHIIK
jgi:hypothetical protein